MAIVDGFSIVKLLKSVSLNLGLGKGWSSLLAINPIDRVVEVMTLFMDVLAKSSDLVSYKQIKHN